MPQRLLKKGRKFSTRNKKGETVIHKGPATLEITDTQAKTFKSHFKTVKAKTPETPETPKTPEQIKAAEAAKANAGK